MFVQVRCAGGDVVAVNPAAVAFVRVGRDGRVQLVFSEFQGGVSSLTWIGVTLGDALMRLEGRP